MSYEALQSRRGRRRPDLHAEHQPRPWKCSAASAVFCTHHGDCTCRARREVDPRCPLHGVDTTHPLAEAVRK